MKEKILAELKKKFSGLSNEFLAFLADKLVPKVTEESQIEGAITELNNSPIPVTDLAAEFQREGDRRATGAAQKRETELKEKYDFSEKKKAEDKPVDTKPNEGGSNSELAEVKAQLAVLTEKLTKQEQQNSREGLLGKLKAKVAEKNKSIPDSFLANKVVEKEEDLDRIADEVVTSYNEVRQHFLNQGMTETGIPLAGSGDAGDGVSGMMNDYLKHNKKPEAK